MLLWELYRSQDVVFQTLIWRYPMHGHLCVTLNNRTRSEVNHESFVCPGGYGFYLSVNAFPKSLALTVLQTRHALFQYGWTSGLPLPHDVHKPRAGADMQANFSLRTIEPSPPCIVFF